MNSSTNKDVTMSDQNIQAGVCPQCGSEGYVITYCPHATVITRINYGFPMTDTETNATKIDSTDSSTQTDSTE